MSRIGDRQLKVLASIDKAQADLKKFDEGVRIAQRQIEKGRRSDFSILCATKDWQWEVANGDTVLGLVEWIEHRKESEAS